MLTFTNAFQWICFAPKYAEFSEYFYNQSDTWINMLSMIYMITYPFLLWPALRVFNAKNNQGLKMAIRIGALLNFMGALIKYLGAVPRWRNFCVVFAGQTFSAASQVFFLAIPPKLASAWFGIHERSKASSLGVMANYFGIAVGFWAAELVRRPFDRTIPDFLMVQAIVCAFVLLFCWFLFPEEPPVSDTDGFQSIPDIDEDSDDAVDIPLFKPDESLQTTITRTLVGLFNDQRFICMLLSFGLTLATNYALSTLLSQLLVPVYHGYTSEHAMGFLGFWMIIAGLVSTFLAGYLMDSFQNSPRFLFIACHGFSCASLLGLHLIIWLMPSSSLSFGIACSFVIAFSFFSTAVLPTSYQYASELFYKYSETIIASLLNTSAQIFGTTLILLMGFLKTSNDEEGTYSLSYGMWISIGFCAVGTLLSCITARRITARLTLSASTEPDEIFA